MPSIQFKMRLVVLSLTLVGLALPTIASASDNQFSIMQDDDLLVYATTPMRDNTLRQMKTYGVDSSG